MCVTGICVTHNVAALRGAAITLIRPVHPMIPDLSLMIGSALKESLINMAIHRIEGSGVKPLENL